MEQPRLVLSGLSGSSGKTLAALGLSRSLKRLGMDVLPFKKGPDYIDAAWLGLAAKKQAANLDPYFLSLPDLRAQFGKTCAEYARERSKGSLSIALIEGNRGLYDGRDVEGSCSTAEVAKALQAPVLLLVNCAKMTRTTAALVAGIQAFDRNVRIGGVILNNIGSARHGDIVRKSVEAYTDVPVLGSLPRLRDNPIPERHMGLSLDGRVREAELALERLADHFCLHADIDAIMTLAFSAPPLSFSEFVPPCRNGSPASSDLAVKPVIGYVNDEALWFYYQENLRALVEAGANLVKLSILDPTPWPHLDGLYLGGGFPELFAERISQSPHLDNIRKMSESGKPVYAECGGFMILSETLRIQERGYPMAGVFPIAVRFFKRPQGLGYVEARTLLANPFHPAGSVWRGHEFHYSTCEPTGGTAPEPVHVLGLSPGTGMRPNDQGQGEFSGNDGLCCGNTFASYTHLYAPAVPHWAANFARLAQSAMERRS